VSFAEVSILQVPFQRVVATTMIGYAIVVGVVSLSFSHVQ